MFNVDDVIARMDEEGALEAFSGVMDKAAQELRRPKGAQECVIVSRRLMDQVSCIVGPYTPCRKGCSGCCHMSVAISATEAAMIGEAIGVTPIKFPGLDLMTVTQQDVVDRYKGVKCPFLEDGCCSIYAHRPAACRGYHNLYPDNSVCNLDAKQETPAMNLFLIEGVYAMGQYTEVIGDLRDFFPTGKLTNE